MSGSNRFTSRFLAVLLFLISLITSVILTFLVTRHYFIGIQLSSKQKSAEAQISYNWKTYTDSHFLFKVKVPQDTEVRKIPAGFDNGDAGISAIDFSSKDFWIGVDPSRNVRNDKTLQSLSEVRDFNNLKNVGVGVCCARESETQLSSGTKVLLEDDFLQNGGKFGMVATILGKKYFYNISTGSIYRPNFTYKEESIFMEFLNTFQVTE